MAARALVFDPLASAFLSKLDAADRQGFASMASLGQTLHAMWQQGVDAWGDLQLGPERYAAQLSSWMPSSCAPEHLSTIDAGEAYIVTACVQDCRGALEAFEAAYFTRALAALMKMSMSSDEIDDILQLVRVRLLLPEDDGRCRLEGYVGRGDLRALIRVVATRAAIDLRRRDKRHVPDDELRELPAADPDPRLLAVRRQCHEHFAPAFRSALADLERRERNLLRLHLVDGVTLATLARSYSVHRATVVRWLAKAREQLLNNLCRSLAERTAINADEVASVAAEIQSQLDLSLSRLMRTASG